MAAPPSRRASPPALPDELVEEILLRLPPDEPACLLRASVVCKAWGSAVSHPSFRRRLHELHGTPPVLGFLHDWKDERVPNFVSTTASAFSLAAPDRRVWHALDCRHGRAFFASAPVDWDSTELLVWEPATGDQQRVPVPAAFESSKADVIMYPGAAVFCDVEGCDHHGCHGGPYRVLFVFTVDPHTDFEEYVTSACEYSSETGTWTELTSKHFEFLTDFGDFPCLLVGSSLVYFMTNGVAILEYDFASNELTEIHTPGCAERFLLMPAEDGGLGLIQDLDSQLKLWSREATDRADTQRWVLSRVINLEKLFPIGALVNASASLFVLGVAEGLNVIFVDTIVGLFTFELLSGRVRKVCGKNDFHQLIPIIGFYTPVPQNKHQDQLLSNAGGEERGDEEKTLDQTQQLFDNGPNAIKEGTLSTRSNVPAMSPDLDDRVPPYGDVAPESTDMGAIKEETSSTRSNVEAMSPDLDDRVLPYGNVAAESMDIGSLPIYEAQEMTGPLGGCSQDCMTEER